HQQSLIDACLLVGIVDEILVVAKALLGLSVVAQLLEDHPLVEDGRGVIRPPLLRVLEELERRDEVVLRVEETSAREEIAVLGIGLPLLLQLALELELELELRHQRLLPAVSK